MIPVSTPWLALIGEFAWHVMAGAGFEPGTSWASDVYANAAWTRVFSRFSSRVPTLAAYVVLVVLLSADSSCFTAVIFVCKGRIQPVSLKFLAACFCPQNRWFFGTFVTEGRCSTLCTKVYRAHASLYLVITIISRRLISQLSCDLGSLVMQQFWQ